MNKAYMDELRRDIKFSEHEMKELSENLKNVKNEILREEEHLKLLKKELELREEEYDNLMKNDWLLTILDQVDANYIGSGIWEFSLENPISGENEEFLLKSEVDEVWGSQTLKVYIKDEHHRMTGIPMDFITLIMDYNFL